MKATLNSRVLPLNQTYEPLGTVSVARASIMVLKNTVLVEEWDDDRVLHSVREKFPAPSVIRRREYLNIRRRREASGTKRVPRVPFQMLTALNQGSRRKF
jgi:hypothetical protein